MNGTIYRNLTNKLRKDILVKFDKTIAMPSLSYSNETWGHSQEQMKKEPKLQT